MSGVGIKAWQRAALGAGALALVLGALSRPLVAADKLLTVDWSSPEIESFVKEQSSARRSLGPTADDKLAKLKLPVIAFGAVPSLVESTFRLGPKPATERDVVIDEKNPVWYQIVERYGDMTVSVEADLRVQHEFPSNYPVYSDTRRGASAQAGPEVSVFDDQNEEAVEGLIAEYTIVKFGVPYTVTIECSGAAKELCHDTGQIAKDSELLKLVRANPPAP